MDWDYIGNIASIVAAIGSPFAIYLAWNQLEVAQRGPDRQALAVDHELFDPVNGEQEFRYHIRVAGPGAFYDLEAYVHFRDRWHKVVEGLVEFHRFHDPIQGSIVIPQEYAGEAKLVLHWGFGSKKTQGLDDHLALVMVKSGDRYRWRVKWLAGTRNRWNRIVDSLFGDDHFLIRPTGRWAKIPEYPASDRSHPGWPRG
ncbi:hypothetical protein [Corynebacterium sp. AOP12-C2-36]|uniref:hypothetical protein n=1 Tax=Corynebacterium sp. AOP12-C2-36 TaxID=3457723 RepID=UPI0040332D5B